MRRSRGEKEEVLAHRGGKNTLKTLQGIGSKLGVSWGGGMESPLSEGVVFHPKGARRKKSLIWTFKNKRLEKGDLARV